MATSRTFSAGRLLIGFILAAVLGMAAPLTAGAAECNGGAGAGTSNDDANTTNTACGTNADAEGGDDNTAIGTETNAGFGGGNQNTAVGADAEAGHVAASNVNNATAIGGSSSAEANDATAIGQGASADFDRSTAIGQGATATRANQMVYGTATETHTMAGITSAASAAAQTGPTEIVTTDAFGNLATDGGSTFGKISRNSDDIDDNSEGIAMAMSIQDPDLVGEERVGLKIGWGTFSGEHAMGVSVAGVVLPDIGMGIRLGVAGGAAFGLSEGNAGGRAGVQLTW